MGAAFYIALEKEIPALDTMIDGKMLDKARECLAEAAKRRGVRPLMDFFSVNQHDLTAFLERKGIKDLGCFDEKWFRAKDGLKTLKALLDEAERSPGVAAAKQDLLCMERILRVAHWQRVKWHLAVDF